MSCAQDFFESLSSAKAARACVQLLQKRMEKAQQVILSNHHRHQIYTCGIFRQLSCEWELFYQSFFFLGCSFKPGFAGKKREIFRMLLFPLVCTC